MPPKFPSKIKGRDFEGRVPCLGKIRLGIKVKSASSGAEYPKDVDYFVCPHEVVKAMSAINPSIKDTKDIKELTVIFPVDDIDVIFPEAYERYGKGTGLKCIGDGETASERITEGKNDWRDKTCPCDYLTGEKGVKKECKATSHLRVMLPDVNMGGVYQIDSGSIYGRADVLAGMAFTKQLLGRLRGVPLILKREATTTHFEGKAATHHTLKLNCQMTGAALAGYYRGQHYLETFDRPLAIAEPIRENPVYDGEATVEYEEAPVLFDASSWAQTIGSAADMDTILSIRAEIDEQKGSIPEQDYNHLSGLANARAAEIEAQEGAGKPKQAPPVESAHGGVNMATEAQRRMLFAVMKQNNVSEQAFKDYLIKDLGITSGSGKDIPASLVNEIKAWLEKE